jgi:hypothetical protein
MNHSSHCLKSPTYFAIIHKLLITEAKFRLKAEKEPCKGRKCRVVILKPLALPRCFAQEDHFTDHPFTLSRCHVKVL